MTAVLVRSKTKRAIAMVRGWQRFDFLCTFSFHCVVCAGAGSGVRERRTASAVAQAKTSADLESEEAFGSQSQSQSQSQEKSHDHDYEPEDGSRSGGGGGSRGPSPAPARGGGSAARVGMSIVLIVFAGAAPAGAAGRERARGGAGSDSNSNSHPGLAFCSFVLDLECANKNPSLAGVVAVRRVAACEGARSQRRLGHATTLTTLRRVAGADVVVPVGVQLLDAVALLAPRAGTITASSVRRFLFSVVCVDYCLGLLDAVEEIEPIGGDGWEKVKAKYNEENIVSRPLLFCCSILLKDDPRDAEALKQQFNKLKNTKPKTGVLFVVSFVALATELNVLVRIRRS